MNKLTYLMGFTMIPVWLLLSGCPDQAADVNSGKVAQLEAGSHEGHDHEAEEVADDPHAGHDHEAEAVADDPHAGHDHEAEVVADDPHAGHDHEAEEVTDDPNAGHDDEAEAQGVGISLSETQIRELGIVAEAVGPGALGRDLELTGEIAINEDAVTHVAPRIGGIIRKVYGNLGDHVRAGAPLLELDSMELGETTSEYLALLSRISLAQQTLDREQMLLDKGISAEQDFLAAKQAVDELLISRRSMEQKLRAMGLSEKQVSSLPDNHTGSLTSYTVFAPASGEIIVKHASVGEVVDSETEVFTIGDLSTVWARLNIFQQDFLDVQEGLTVVIDAGHGVDPITGSIDYIEPLIGEETRTAIARVVIPRSNHVFRPGLFITGYVEVGEGTAELLVPRTAVVDLDMDSLVFVKTGTSFEPRVVETGRQTARSIEILSGITSGEDVVIAGAFQLKAELLKGTFDPHAGHAH